MMLRGSCLCGSVRYEIRGPVSQVTHCHRSMCRKAHGAAFASYGRVERGDFHLLSGSSDIASYRSSPDVVRTFCRHCGSTLQFISEKRPATRAPWFQIADDLPQHAERP